MGRKREKWTLVAQRTKNPTNCLGHQKLGDISQDPVCTCVPRDPQKVEGAGTLGLSEFLKLVKIFFLG
jgi:hypothetical protein